MQNSYLKMSEITKIYGKTKVLDSVSFDLRLGEVHALVGENGAGKSTLIKILSGSVPPNGGSISIEGNAVEIHNPHMAHECGISVVHQELAQALDLSVAENIFMGRYAKNIAGMVDFRKLNSTTKKLLENIDSEIDPAAKMRTLSIAKRQMVEITKAISYGARIIVFDEPTSSLSEGESEKLFEIIRKLKQQGIGVIYISHRMEEIFDLSDRVTVLRDGHWIQTSNIANISQEDLIKAMIGRNMENMYPEHDANPGEVVLSVSNIVSKDVKDVSFEVRKGEILGFGGLIGAGRTELMRAIIGLDRHTGSVEINGKPVQIKRIKQAIKNGISYLTEDRKGLGLVMPFEIMKNISLSTLIDCCRTIFLSDKKEKDLSDSFVEKLRVVCTSSRAKVSSLSGGNQQKVLLARCLASNPDILILDEPTRGVDVGAKSEIYKIITDLTKTGVAVLLVSSDLPELIALSDRIVVMCEGEKTKELKKEEISEFNVMKYAVGKGA